MPRIVIAMLVASTLGLGFATQASAEDRGKERWCDRRDVNCDGRYDWRDRRQQYDRRDDYGRAPTYEPAGTCTFRTRHGAVTGYKPRGKDRCCIETRNGPSCQ
ncbi:hypothetical protein [Vineibacter terrae]|uniref:hypothetical protein n=1 Tax=Vineibacter terrae TaxID=2586908 RepID=UPI002E349D86|nr:hypothetical protein [Vineibacter terrae]HEX2890443.1 hypothetical protein [Vineibacter terrae]